MIHFKHIKRAVEGSLQGRVSLQLETVCPLQLSAWGAGNIWISDRLFCEQQG